MKISGTTTWIVIAVILIGLLGWATARILNKPQEQSSDISSSIRSTESS